MDPILVALWGNIIFGILALATLVAFLATGRRHPALLRIAGILVLICMGFFAYRTFAA